MAGKIKQKRLNYIITEQSRRKQAMPIFQKYVIFHFFTFSHFCWSTSHPLHLEQHRVGGGKPLGAHLLRIAAGARAVLLQRDLEELGAARLDLAGRIEANMGSRDRNRQAAIR